MKKAECSHLKSYKHLIIKFHIGRNKSKVNSTETGRTVIAHFFA